MKSVKDSANENDVRLDALMRYAGTTVNKISEMRLNILQNDLMPEKILIPSSRLFNLKIEFYDGQEVVVTSKS